MKKYQAFLFSLVIILIPLPAVSQVVINELLVSHDGIDNTEFVELFGEPETSLAGLSLIVVEGDSGVGPGTIDRRIDFKSFHRLGVNGQFLIGVCEGLQNNHQTAPDSAVAANFLENSSLTVALVETASLADSQVTGNEVVVDSVAFSDGDAGDQFYFDATVLTDNGALPAGAWREEGLGWEVGGADPSVGYTPLGGGLDACQSIPLTIAEIQGREPRSEYEGEVVTTTGIVTQYSADGRHFWLQDPQGDNDEATSEGIFVSTGGELEPAPVVGDHVQLTGLVEEWQSGLGLPLTRLIEPRDLTVLSSGNDLPLAVALQELPAESVTEAIDFWERLEGMRVSLEEGTVVGPTNRFGEFVVLARNNARPGSGYRPGAKRLFLRALPEGGVDYNPERIVVDDFSLGEAPIATVGDKVTELVGVVDYAFGNYRIQAGLVDIAPDLARTTSPIVRPDPTAIGVATFNVENLFDIEDDPEKQDGGSTPTPDELAIKMSKLALAFDALSVPEIVVIEEVENQALLEQVAERLNVELGADYQGVSYDTSDARGIEVGFLWDRRRVTLVDAFQMAGADVDAAFGAASPSPGREPLIGVFNVAGTTLNVIGLHLKSKGGDDPLFGRIQPPNRATEQQRKAQARVVRDYVNRLLADTPDARVIVAGDLNDFPFPEPGEGEHPVGILLGDSGAGEALLTNLVARLPEAAQYTYVHEGNSQVLDHLLAAGLDEAFVGIDALHINASFPVGLGSDAETIHRVSDHDPIVAYFKLNRPVKSPLSGALSGPTLALLLAMLLLVFVVGWRRPGAAR